MNAIGVPSGVDPDRSGSINRRTLLIIGGTLALSGCTTSQRPGSSSSSSHPPPPTPKPTPLPGAVDAVQRENHLAATAALALDHVSHLSTSQRNLLTSLRDAHADHAAVLGRPDPFDATGQTDRSPSPTPSMTASPKPTKSAKTALARLVSLEKQAAAAYSELAADPTGPQDQLGQLALLWGSLAAAATGYASVIASGRNPGASVTGDDRMNVAAADQTKAMQNLLEQCHAIIFGYQAAIAALTDDHAEHARTSLAGYRDLRDQLSAALTEQKASVPAPKAAYRLPVQPTSDTRAVRLITSMEIRLLPYLGQWLSVADDRKTSLTTMINTAEDAQSWSPKIIVWPGYPTRS